MPTISRGTIKSYDAPTHTASVQIAGSLAVWLDAVPVSDAISPSDVVAGRECGVIFFTDDDPNDAAVITVHHALPIGSHRLRDADGDTFVDVERTANVNLITMTTAGTERVLVQNVSPHVTLSGDVLIQNSAVTGPGTLTVGLTPNSSILGQFEDSVGAAQQVGLGAWVGASANIGNNVIVGVTGKAVMLNQTTSVGVYGLDFAFGFSGLGATVKTLANFAGIRVTPTGATATGLTITSMYGMDIQALSYTGLVAVNNYKGVYVRGTSNAKFVTVRGVQVDAYTGTTTAFNPFYDTGQASTRDADGNRFRSNSQFASVTGSFGSGDGVIGLAYATTNPSANPTGGVVIYASSASGDTKVRGAGGQICTLPTGGAPNVTGSRGGNAALASLCATLAALGLIVDSTT